MRRGSVLALTALALSGSVRAAQAQGIGLHGVDGELGSEFDGRWIGVQAARGPSINQFREWLDLRLSGWALYPGIFDFDIDLQPQFTQSRLQTEATSSSKGVRTLNGGVDVRLLSARRLSLRGYYRRSAQRSYGSFGTGFDGDRSEWGIEVQDRNPYLPVRFELWNDTNDSRFMTASTQTPVRTNLRTKLLRLTARNSKIRLRLERHELEDRVLGSERTRSLGSFEHTLRWGKGSQLSSGVDRWTTSGSGEAKGLTFSESLILRHRTNLSSGYSYSYGTTTTPSDVQHLSLGQITSNYAITPGVQVGAQGFGNSRWTRSGIRQSTYRVGSQLALGTSLPLGVRADAAGHVGHEWLEQGSENGLIEVVDEPHAIGQAGRFRLNESFAEPATVMVRRQDGLLLEPDIDYRVVEVGPFLEIVLLPGGRVQVGDTVLVDYEFRLIPTASGRTLTWGYNLNLGMGPLRLYHDRSVRDDLDEAPEVVLPALRDLDQRLYGATLELPFSFGSLSARAEYRASESSTYSNRSKVVGGALRVDPTRRLTVSIRSELSAQRSADYSLDILRTDAILEWSALRGLDVRAGVRHWNWDEPDRNNSFLGGEVAVTARLRQLTLEAGFDRLKWTNGSDRTESRVYVSLVRRL
jgi:hypothetical protein